MNTEFKFFNGIVGEYAQEPSTDEWWTELEVEAALERAGQRLREDQRVSVFNYSIERKRQMVKTMLENMGYVETENFSFEDDTVIVNNPTLNAGPIRWPLNTILQEYVQLINRR